MKKVKAFWKRKFYLKSEKGAKAEFEKEYFQNMKNFTISAKV